MDLDAHGVNKRVFNRLGCGAGPPMTEHKVCNHWRAGRCNRFPCPYLHRESPSLPPHQSAANGHTDTKQFNTSRSRLGRSVNDKVIRKTEKLCSYWAQGSCNYGEKCKNLHCWSSGDDDFRLVTQLGNQRKEQSMSDNINNTLRQGEGVPPIPIHSRKRKRSNKKTEQEMPTPSENCTDAKTDHPIKTGQESIPISSARSESDPTTQTNPSKTSDQPPATSRRGKEKADDQNQQPCKSFEQSKGKEISSSQNKENPAYDDSPADLFSPVFWKSKPKGIRLKNKDSILSNPNVCRNVAEVLWTEPDKLKLNKYTSDQMRSHGMRSALQTLQFFCGLESIAIAEEGKVHQLQKNVDDLTNSSRNLVSDITVMSSILDEEVTESKRLQEEVNNLKESHSKEIDQLKIIFEEEKKAAMDKVRADLLNNYWGEVAKSYRLGFHDGEFPPKKRFYKNPDAYDKQLGVKSSISEYLVSDEDDSGNGDGEDKVEEEEKKEREEKEKDDNEKGPEVGYNQRTLNENDADPGYPDS